MPVLYFFMGFVTAVMAMFVWAARSEVKPKKKRSKWQKVNSCSFRWQFDYQIPETTTLKDILEALPYLMERQLKKTPVSESGVTDIDPGKYSIDLQVHAKFVERDPEAPGGV